MAFPSYIPTRVVSVGGSSGLESGRLLRTVVDVKASRSLIWDDTGARLEATGVAGVSSEGSEVTFELPRTDVQGWKDAKTGALIDVSAPEAYSHRYVATVSFQDESGRKVGASYTLGPFVVTAGDGPIDLDKMVPASTVAGDAVSIPDRWAGLVGDALQAAVDSANAAEVAAAAVALAAPRESATFYVQDHGLQGDWIGNDANGSGTNDTAAMQGLLSSIPVGSRVVMGRGKRYRLDPLVLTTDNITIDWNNCTVITQTQTAASVAAPLLAVRGAFGDELTMGSISRGATRIYPADHLTVLPLFSVGDWIVLRDSKPWPVWGTGGSGSPVGRAEVVQVLSIGSTSLELAVPASQDYSFAPRFQKLTPVVGFRSVGDPTVMDTNPGRTYVGIPEETGPHLIYCSGTVSAFVGRVIARGFQGHVVNFYRSSAPRAEGIEGYGAFRPEAGGHGYVSRFVQCTDGLVEGLIGEGVRHVANYVNSHRSGSRKCLAIASDGTPFQTHGLGSTGIFSEDDKVVGGKRPGWGFGNPAFSSDFGMTIVRPTYHGVRQAIVARTGSAGLRVTAPDIHTSSTVAAIHVCEGASDVRIDTTGGVVEMIGTPGAVPAILARATYEDTDPVIQKPGDVEIRGDGFAGSHRFDIDIAGGLALVGAPSGDVRLTAAGDNSRILETQDGSEIGVARTFLAAVAGSTTTWPSANEGRFARVLTGARISKIAMNVGVSSGNISLAVYRGAGIGMDRKPVGPPVVSTGPIPCPPAGYQTVDLGATVEVLPGDYLFMSCDNATASFSGQNGQTSELYRGTGFGRGSAHPAPAVPGALGGSATRIPHLLGL